MPVVSQCPQHTWQRHDGIKGAAWLSAAAQPAHSGRKPQTTQCRHLVVSRRRKSGSNVTSTALWSARRSTPWAARRRGWSPTCRRLSASRCAATCATSEHKDARTISVDDGARAADVWGQAGRAHDAAGEQRRRQGTPYPGASAEPRRRQTALAWPLNRARRGDVAGDRVCAQKFCTEPADHQSHWRRDGTDPR